MRYLLVAAVALGVGLWAAGTPVAALLPYALLLACPLMMVVMMRAMGGHGGHTGHGGGLGGQDRSGSGDHRGRDAGGQEPVAGRGDLPTGR